MWKWGAAEEGDVEVDDPATHGTRREAIRGLWGKLGSPRGPPGGLSVRQGLENSSGLEASSDASVRLRCASLSRL